MSVFEEYKNGDHAIPKVMQALVACGKGFENLSVKEVPVPEIGPDQINVPVRCRLDGGRICRVGCFVHGTEGPATIDASG